MFIHKLTSNVTATDEERSRALWVLEVMQKYARNPIHNYCVPGLKSYIISSQPDGSLLRLFHSEREQLLPITPHSHRYDLRSTVLQGSVLNVLWNFSEYSGDEYMVSNLKYRGKPGEYFKEESDVRRYKPAGYKYGTGCTYNMSYSDIHSIYFSRSAWVLIEQGPTISETSVVLEPVTEEGIVIPTMSEKSPEWMFLSDRESQTLRGRRKDAAD